MMALGRYMMMVLALTAMLPGAIVTAAVPAAQSWPSAPLAPVRRLLGVKIPMRDGVTLVADIWLPAAPGRYPLVMQRTPYGRNMDPYAPYDSMIKQAHDYASRGIAFMIEDVRGRGDSGGEFTFFRNEGRDGYDTIEWTAAQGWSNGQVAMLGGSYTGTVQWLAAREHPPHLTCLFSQAPGADYFNEVPYVGGAFQLQWSMSWPLLTSGRLMQSWLANDTDYATLLAHRPLLTLDAELGRELPMVREFLAHPTLDSWWRQIMLSQSDFEGLDIPSLQISGWYDSQLDGNMFYWNGMRDHSPAAAKQRLILGAWTHAETRSGGSARIGDRDRGAESVLDIPALALRWFHSCFDGTTESFQAPRAQIFLTGVNRWISLADYPAGNAQQRSLYLQSQGDAAETQAARGRLTWSPPPARAPSDAYTFNPLDAVPERGSFDHFQPAQTQRQDVLVYTTDALTSPLTILGPVDLVLLASTSAKDTDFVANLYDVDSSGRALRMVFRTAVLRTRYREGFDRQIMMTPGQPTRLILHFFDVGHVIMPGHRLRLEVASNTPGINPNQNTGNDVGTDTTWVSARQRVFHDAVHASHLELPIVPYPFR